MFFNPLKLIYHVRVIWASLYMSQKELDEATATPVEAGEKLDISVAKLQKQVDEILEIIGS